MARYPQCEIWNYFDNIVDEGVAVCKTCQHRLRNNRTFNLRQHLRKLHCTDIEVPETNSSQQHPYSPQPYDEEQINDMLKVAKRKMKLDRQYQQDKRGKKRICIEMEQKIVVRAIMGLMLEEGIGPHVFDSKHMLALLKPLCDAISDQRDKAFTVNSSNCESSLCSVATNIQQDFSNDMKWRLLSLKIDTDVNASHKTYCVSALFVNEGQVETRVLGIVDLVKDFEENHFSKNHFSENHIKEILNKFNIDCKQIVVACWDHTKARFKQPVANSEYSKEMENFENYPEIFIGHIRVEPYIGIIAQLCFMDIFKKSSIFQKFLECRNLVKYLNNKSNGYYQIFDTHQLRIPQMDSPWKWGSSYTMMNDLLVARDILNNVKFEEADELQDQFNLNENLWSFIEDFCKVLNFLQKSILRYYGEEQNFGDFYAQWLKCKLLTEKLITGNKNEDNFIAIIGNELLRSIEKRSKKMLRQERFDACLYLDPRFQHTLDLQRKSNALEYLKKLWSRAKTYNKESEQFAEVAESDLHQQFDDDEDAFLNEFLSKDLLVKDATIADVYARIERLKLPFQMVDSNILFFWRELKLNEPELHELSSICFAMPATQIYSKVRYSHILSMPDSPKLSKSTKENLLFIRLNAHLVDDAIEQVVIFKDDTSSTNVANTQVEDEGEPAVLPEEENRVGDKTLIVTTNPSPLPTTTTNSTVALTMANKEMFNNNVRTLEITHLPPLLTTDSIPAMSTATAIITPAGTAFLPPNIIIKPITTTSN